MKTKKIMIVKGDEKYLVSVSKLGDRSQADYYTGVASCDAVFVLNKGKYRIVKSRCEKTPKKTSPKEILEYISQ